MNFWDWLGLGVLGVFAFVVLVTIVGIVHEHGAKTLVKIAALLVLLYLCVGCLMMARVEHLGWLAASCFFAWLLFAFIKHELGANDTD